MPYNPSQDPYTDPAMGSNAGKGQMKSVDPDNPYEVAHHERRRIDAGQRRNLEFAENEYNRIRNQGGYGEAVLNQGLGRATSAMQSQAVSRGANPLAERAALLGGGQMMRQGSVDAAAIRAQEMAAAGQAYQQQLQQQVATEMYHEQMERQRNLADQAHYGAMVSGDLQETQQDWNNYGGMISGGATGAMMMSDIQLKDGTCVPMEQVADDAIAGLGGGWQERNRSALRTELGSLGREPAAETASPVMQAAQPIAQSPDAFEGAAVGYTPRGGAPIQVYPDQAAAYNAQGNAAAQQQMAAGTAAAMDSGGGLLGGLLGSDIKLKDGTCIPATDVQDEHIRSMALAMGEERIGSGSEEDRIRARTATRAGVQDEMDGVRLGGVQPQQVTMRPEFSREDLDRGLYNPYQPLTRQIEGYGTRPAPRRQPREDYVSLAAALDREGAATEAELDRTASHLQPKTWRYKQGAQRALGLPSGERVGPMAQDLERSQLGRLAVQETPAGKGIDRDAALGLSLGLHGRHGERDDEMEARVRRLEAALKREGKRTESKL